jgi:hypothetical protein
MFNRFFNRCYLAAGGVILAQLGNCSALLITMVDQLDPMYVNVVFSISYSHSNSQVVSTERLWLPRTSCL